MLLNFLTAAAESPIIFLTIDNTRQSGLLSGEQFTPAANQSILSATASAATLSFSF